MMGAMSVGGNVGGGNDVVPPPPKKKSCQTAKTQGPNLQIFFGVARLGIDTITMHFVAFQL